MNYRMTRGLRIYTAALFLTIIASLVFAAPEHAIFGGVAVLATITAMLATRLGPEIRRDLQQAQRPGRPAAERSANPGHMRS